MPLCGCRALPRLGVPNIVWMADQRLLEKFHNCQLLDRENDLKQKPRIDPASKPRGSWLTALFKTRPRGANAAIVTNNSPEIISGSHVRHHDDLSYPVDEESTGKTPRPQVPTPRKSSPAPPISMIASDCATESAMFRWPEQDGVPHSPRGVTPDASMPYIPNVASPRFASMQVALDLTWSQSSPLTYQTQTLLN